MQFLKYVLATILGLILFMVLSFFILIGIGAAFSSGDDTPTVKANSVLQIDLNKSFNEKPSKEDQFSGIFGNTTPSVNLFDLKSAIENAKLDPNIKAISIKAEYPMAGFAQLQELRASLKEFKKSGKKIFMYGDIYTEKGLYLATLADQSFINPVGGVEFNGLGTELTFFKRTFDKLGIKPVIFKVGDYKSAVEPFIRTDMSPENEEQIKSYLASISNQIYGEMAEDIKVPRIELDNILNQNLVQEPEDAVKYKLLSAVGYLDQYEKAIKDYLKISTDKKINYTKLSTYIKAKKYKKDYSGTDKIAVIYSEGEIAGTESNDGISSDDFVKDLKRAREDKKVKAVVLRIDSPGGSALASDIMWREIELTKKVKPVIASMGNVAASGGYYMAMAADSIVAQPTTITGSIGIFAMLFNMKDFLNNKLGVSTDYVSTHTFANSPSVTREMSDAEKAMIQKSINKGYETFTSKAAAGRGMSIDKLKSVASGRVWTGTQAKENGLVDVLGGLDKAIEIAAQKAKLKKDAYSIKSYPFAKSEFEKIMESFKNSNEDAALKQALGPLYPYAKEINTLSKMDRMQARLPYTIEIK
jgi:protease IV